MKDIGLFAATIFRNVIKHTDKAYELTSDEALSFRRIAKAMGLGLEKKG